jgi:hypothetical protein
MARPLQPFPDDPAIVVLNADEDVTAELFQEWLDRRQRGELDRHRRFGWYRAAP